MSGLPTGFYNTDGYYRWTESSFRQDRVQKLNKSIVNLIDGKSGLNILDIGCGTGGFTQRLAERFPSNTYYGSDVSSVVIDINKKDALTQNIVWSVDNFNAKTNFDTDFFDVVIGGEVIEHLVETDFFLKEVLRMIKPGGYFVITTPNLASWLDRITLLFGMQPFSTEVSNDSRVFGRRGFYKFIHSEESRSAGHLRCFTKGALIDMLNFYNFKLIEEIPCHVHDMLINRFVDVVLPGMSENTLIVAQK